MRTQPVGAAERQSAPMLHVALIALLAAYTICAIDAPSMGTHDHVVLTYLTRVAVVDLARLTRQIRQLLMWLLGALPPEMSSF